MRFAICEDIEYQLGRKVAVTARKKFFGLGFKDVANSLKQRLPTYTNFCRTNLIYKIKPRTP